MKNKIFSKGIYLDTFRRLKIVGIIFGVYLLISCVFFVGTDRVAIAPFNYLRPLYMVPYVITPVIAGVAFNIYSKRKTSDFYSSLPVSKFSRMFSVSLAVLSILISGIFIGALLSMAVLSIKTVLIVSGFWDVVLTVIASTLFAFASFVLAQSMTGNVVTTIISYFVNLFFVRYFLYVVRGTFLAGQASLNTKYFLRFLIPDMNTFVGGIFDGNVFMDAANIQKYGIGNIKEDIWTIFSSLVFFIIASVIFSKRLSEKDSSPFISYGAFLYNTGVIIFVISTFLCATNYLVDGSFSSLGMVENILLLIVFPIFGISVLSIIYLKGGRNTARALLKALPALIAVVFINVSILVLGGYLEKNKILKNIEPENVESVQLIMDSDNNLNPVYRGTKDLQSEKITDKKSVAQIISIFNRNIDSNADLITDNVSEGGVICKINTKDGKTIYGKTSFNSDDFLKYTSSEKNISDYIKKLPEPDFRTFVTTNNEGYDPKKNKILKSDEAEKIFKTAQNELNKYSVDEISDVFANGMISIIYYSKSGDDVDLSISPIAFPETVKALIPYFNCGGKLNDVQKYISDGKIKVDTVCLYLKDSDGKYTYDSCYSIPQFYTDEYGNEQTFDKSEKLIKKLLSESVSEKDFGSGYLVAEGVITDESSPFVNQYTNYIIPAPSGVTDKDIEEIKNCIKAFESISVNYQ